MEPMFNPIQTSLIALTTAINVVSRVRSGVWSCDKFLREANTSNLCFKLSMKSFEKFVGWAVV